MPNLVTFPVSSAGGLDIVTPPHLVAQKPGVAVRLENYESLIEGGYHRISGYSQITSFNDVIDIRGISIFDDAPVFVKGTAVVRQATVGFETINSTNALVGTGRVQMVELRPAEDKVLFVTDPDTGAPIVITKDSLGNFTDVVATPTPALVGAKYCAVYQDHVVVAGMPTAPGKVAVSTRFDPSTFDGTGSWEFQVQDTITGIHVFRGFLYVFCSESIYRVKNLTNQAQAVVEPVTSKIGCIDGATIQEVGGDIMFLANDGLRYLGGTERIDDVAINLQSTLIDSIVENISLLQGGMDSCVIPDKRQYRLFYHDRNGIRRGLIGTLMQEGLFAWSTTTDMQVQFIHSGDIQGVATTFHADFVNVFNHESGNTFNGNPFVAIYTTPYMHMGDSQIRKRCHSMSCYLESRGTASLELTVRFDHEQATVIQPEPFPLSPVIVASRFGVSRYGPTHPEAGTYGAVRYPLETIFLEGSGKWVQFEFRDNDDGNSRYIIRGFDLNFTTGGRI